MTNPKSWALLGLAPAASCPGENSSLCEEWLYLVQVRQQEKSSVIAGAATGRVGLKYLIWEGAKSPAQGLPWNTLV